MRPPPPLLPHPLGLEDISGSGKWSTPAGVRLNRKEKENEKKNSKFPAKMKFLLNWWKPGVSSAQDLMLSGGEVVR